MIEDLALRWTVTILFVITAVECTIAAYGVRQNAMSVVGNSIHVLMSLAMAVMAWPQGAELPRTPPMVFFLLAAVWFAAMMFVGAGRRVGNLYHVAMMLAMAWMYAWMNGDLYDDSDPAPHDIARHGSHIPGLDHQGMNLPQSEESMDFLSGLSSTSPDDPVWIESVNWLCAIGFAIATAYWFYRYLTHRADSTVDVVSRLGLLCQAMMAGGIATMFGLTI